MSSKHFQILAAFLLLVATIGYSSSQDLYNTIKEDGSGCSCVGYECGCCAHLDVPQIELNDTGCVNVTYLPSPDYGISVAFSLDGRVLYNYTVSVRNPPPMCFGIPYLTKYAGICLKFYDINFTATSLSACIQAEIKLEGFIVEKYDLGCFKIPPNSKEETLKYIPRKQPIYSKDFAKIFHKVFKDLEE